MREVLVLLSAYLLYSASRWLAIGDLRSAIGHARWIESAERATGLGVELSVQHAFQGRVVLSVLDAIYLAAQVAVVPAALVLTYRRRRWVYDRLRRTIVATWLLALPVFAFAPVAPPRLAGIGRADTAGAAGVALNSHLATSFYNPLAAMPSLHCGFALAVSIALVRTIRNPLGRAFGALWAPVVILAVIATGNHFVFDVAGGLALTLGGFCVSRRFARNSSMLKRLPRW
jgi:PAP2 superfamily